MNFPLTANFPPFFPPIPLQQRWRGFIPCLIVAFLLRATVGVSTDWIVRPDELFQYLEQAHRLVFGYGQITWEYRMGLRSWLLPAIPAAMLWLCKFVGAATPDLYIPAVKIWNAALSLSIPVGMYLFGRRIFGETTARLALLFGCFWHEFIILGAHTLAEQYAAAVFFLALALLIPTAATKRLLLVGFLLGLTAALRLPYLPLVGVFGLALLRAYPLRQWRWIFVGGVAALLLLGAVDYLSWGRWWHSTRLYLDLFFFNNVTDEPGNWPAPTDQPFHKHLQFMADSSYGLYALSLGAFFVRRQCWQLLLPAIAVFILHTAVDNKNYTNLLVLWALLHMLIAFVAVQIRGTAPSFFRRYAAHAVGGLLLFVTAVSFAGGVPNPSINSTGSNLLTPKEQGLLRANTAHQAARYLASLPPDSVRAVWWVSDGSLLYTTGGYYYMHQRAPILFPELIPEHWDWVQRRQEPRYWASHIIAQKDGNFPGFSPQKQFGDIVVFGNDEPQLISNRERFATDLPIKPWSAIEGIATEWGVEFPPPQPTYLQLKQ